MANKTISIGFKLDDNGQGLKTLTMDADALRKAMGSVVEEAGMRIISRSCRPVIKIIKALEIRICMAS